MSEFSFWLAIGIFLMAVFLWIYLFRKTRSDSPDSESRKKHGSWVLLLVVISIATGGLRILDRNHPLEDALIITFGFVIALLLGIIISVIFIPKNAPETPFQHRINIVTILMIYSFIWLGIPYVGIVFLPSVGLDPLISIAVTAFAAMLVAAWEFVE